LEFITVRDFVEDKLLLLLELPLNGVGRSQSPPVETDSFEVRGVLDEVDWPLLTLLIEVDSRSGASHSFESIPMPLLAGP
jgi:hypothetical protein